MVFTAQNDLSEAQAFYRSVKAQLAECGRTADAALVMPGVMPVVGRTEREAREIFAELNRNIDTAQAFTVLSERLGADMSVHPLDGPVPAVPETEHLKSRAALLIQMVRRENLTLRELYHRVAAARGHLLPIGTPSQVADVLERWFPGRRPPTGSTSCRRSSLASSTPSPRASCRSCRSADCSVPTTPAPHCATTLDWGAPPTVVVDKRPL